MKNLVLSILLIVAGTVASCGFFAAEKSRSNDNLSDKHSDGLSVQIDSIVRSQFPDADAPGLAISVIQDHQVVLQKAYGLASLENKIENLTTTNFRMASVSKQFTALAVYRLIEKGLLGFDTPIGKLFEGLAPVPAQVTVGQLLHHTSGLWDYEGLIPDDRQEQVSDTDVLNLIRGQEQTYFPPGTQFRYSNTGFCLLSLVVERVSGQPYAQYMQEHILTSFGMDLGVGASYMYEVNKDMPRRAFGYKPLASGEFRFADQSITSATKGDGCVYVSAEGYANWSNHLISTSRATAAVAPVQSVAVGDFFNVADYLETIDRLKFPVKDSVYYSLGWFVAPSSQNPSDLRLFHSGETTGFRNIVYHNLGQGLSVTIFANRDDTGIAQVFEETLRLLGEEHPVEESLFFWMSSVY